MKDVADVSILGFLGKSITDRTIKDSTGEDSVKHLPKTLELCARIATHSPKNADFYQIYSKLLEFDGEINPGRQVRPCYIFLNYHQSCILKTFSYELVHAMQDIGKKWL